MGTALPHRAFVKLGRTIKRHRREIEAARKLKLSNALVESTNNKTLFVLNFSLLAENPTPGISAVRAGVPGTPVP